MAHGTAEVSGIPFMDRPGVTLCYITLRYILTQETRYMVKPEDMLRYVFPQGGDTLKQPHKEKEGFDIFCNTIVAVR